LSIFGEDVGAMGVLVDRALALTPSYARGWYVSGWLQLNAGEADLAIERIEKSLRLSPRDYLGNPMMVIGSAHLLRRRFEMATENFKLAVRQIPASPWSYRGIAACYAHLGRLQEARAILGQLRAIGASVMPTRIPYYNRELNELLIAGLRLALGEGA
jgi:adenylate cyclase